MYPLQMGYQPHRSPVPSQTKPTGLSLLHKRWNPLELLYPPPSLLQASHLERPSGDFSPDERSKACGLLRTTIRLGLWLESWPHQGNRPWKAAALCSQSENNNPSLMEGWFTLQAEFQVAWMVPTGPSFNQPPGSNIHRHTVLNFLHWFTHDLCWWAGDSSLK